MPYAPEVKRQQENYARSTNELVKEYGGTFFERLIGQGVLTKEEVARMDAEMESEAVDEVKKCEAHPENAEALIVSRQTLDRIRNSNLIATAFDVHAPAGMPPYTLPDTSAEYGHILQGTLNGQHMEMQYERNRKDGTLKLWSDSFIGDHDMTISEAEKIDTEYFPIAHARYLKIQEIVRQNEQRKVPTVSHAEEISEEAQQMKEAA